MSKFIIIGIKEPGRINAKLDGRFTDIELYTASDEVLEKLYNDKCPYIELASEGISVKPVKARTRNRS